MSLYVVSDLHIWGPEDPVYASLLSLLRNGAKAGDTLVLAGDLFDLFVGRKRIYLERYTGFFEELKAAGSRGVRIHYIEGNHDFLIRRAFSDIPGFQVHSHDVKIELNGKRFFVAHGDTVDRTDYGYRALRMFFRSPVMKALVAAAPGKWLDQIGNKSSQTSRKRKPLLPKELPIEKMEYLRKIYRSFAAERLSEGYDFVVLGHCHDLDEMRFSIGGRTGQYVNVGYPRVHGSYLAWSEGDNELHREPLPDLKS
jgi:UDP-2,3-diacylglucosamine hydrolase